MIVLLQSAGQKDLSLPSQKSWTLDLLSHALTRDVVPVGRGLWGRSRSFQISSWDSSQTVIPAESRRDVTIERKYFINVGKHISIVFLDAIPIRITRRTAATTMSIWELILTFWNMIHPWLSEMVSSSSKNVIDKGIKTVYVWVWQVRERRLSRISCGWRIWRRSIMTWSVRCMNVPRMNRTCFINLRWWRILLERLMYVHIRGKVNLYSSKLASLCMRRTNGTDFIMRMELRDGENWSHVQSMTGLSKELHPSTVQQNRSEKIQALQIRWLHLLVSRLEIILPSKSFELWKWCDWFCLTYKQNY